MTIVGTVSDGVYSKFPPIRRIRTAGILGIYTECSVIPAEGFRLVVLVNGQELECVGADIRKEVK